MLTRDVTNSIGDIYYWIETSCNGRRLRGITYGDGKFIAVGVDKEIYYSEDGINWTIVNHGIEDIYYRDELFGVTYGNRKFVAVGEHIIYHSDDGINWDYAPISKQDSFTLNKVVYGDGKFVAVGASTNSGIYYSVDGIEWTKPTISEIGNYLNGVTYGKDTYVAVGLNGNIIYSYDGIEWLSSSYNDSANLNAVSYVNDRFIAVGERGIVLSSEDGIEWVEVARTNIISDNLNGVAYGKSPKNDDNIFVVNGGALLYSIDGVDWTRGEINQISGMLDLIYADGKFISVTKRCPFYLA